MAQYPARGSEPWDLTLKAYIDGEVATLREITPTLEEQAMTVSLDTGEMRFRDHGAHQWVGGGADGTLVWTYPLIPLTDP